MFGNYWKINKGIFNKENNWIKLTLLKENE